MFFPVWNLASGMALAYILAAIIPAVVLMWYVYRQDTVEKEPWPLLWSLIVRGLLAAAVSVLLEYLGIRLLTRVMAPDHLLYKPLLAFLVVALVEEGAKFLFLKRRTWKDPNFNYRFDGVVYAVFVSLGFAAIENVGYVFQYGLPVAVSRAVLSVPGHMGFAVVMGVFYGRARLKANLGNVSGSRLNQCVGLALAVFLHGFYDTCTLIASTPATVVFLVFVVVMYVAVFRLLRRESRTDVPV